MLKIFRKRVTQVLKNYYPEGIPDGLYELIGMYGECKCKTSKVRNISYPEIWELIKRNIHIFQNGKKLTTIGEMNPFEEAIVLLFHNSWDDAEAFVYNATPFTKTILCSSSNNLKEIFSFFNVYQIEKDGTLTEISEVNSANELICISKQKFCFACGREGSIVIRYLPQHSIED